MYGLWGQIEESVLERGRVCPCFDDFDGMPSEQLVREISVELKKMKVD